MLSARTGISPEIEGEPRIFGGIHAGQEGKAESRKRRNGSGHAQAPGGGGHDQRATRECEGGRARTQMVAEERALPKIGECGPCRLEAPHDILGSRRTVAGRTAGGRADDKRKTQHLDPDDCCRLHPA